MNPSAARAWLDARTPVPPPPLARRIDAALGDVATAGDLPTLFAEAGLRCLRVALADAQSRPAAFDLLAADALLTYACEAAAERGLDAIDALAAALDPERFAGLLEAER